MIQRLTIGQFNVAYSREIQVQRRMVAGMKTTADALWKAVEYDDAVQADFLEGELLRTADIFDHYARALCVCFEVETGVKLGMEAA